MYRAHKPKRDGGAWAESMACVGATRTHPVNVGFVSFLPGCDSKPIRSILREEEFVWAQSFRDIVHLGGEDVVDFLVVGAHGGSSSHRGRPESKDPAAEVGQQRPALSDLSPSS